MVPSIYGENMFDDFFDNSFFGGHSPLFGKHERNLMKTDIHETDDAKAYRFAVELPGFQGVTPLEYDCGQCGECYLNLTGGICPITACSKSLVNGPCGGTKNGKCEVNPEMDCGWERIIQRLKAQGRLDVLKCPTQIHDFNTDEATKSAKESE